MTDDTSVPGTVLLVDLEHILRSKHARGRLNDVVLVPQPSSNPEDPLNWSHHRKLLNTVCWCLYTFVVGIANSVVYSVLVPITVATGLSGNISPVFAFLIIVFLTDSQSPH